MRGRLVTLVLALMLAGSALGQGDFAVAQAAPRAAVTATGLYANASGLSMDAGSARKSGVIVRVHKDSDRAGKRWLRERDGTIRPAYDTRLCLDVPRAHYRAGVKLDVATCKNLKSQRFASARPSASTPVFSLSPVGDRKLCLSLSDGSFDGGDAVSLAACGPMLTGTGTEVWAAANLAAKAGELQSTVALGVPGTAAGTPVIATVPFDLPLGSMWEVGTTSVAPFGQERVLHPLSNLSLCLTRAGPEAAGTALRLEKCSGAAAQAFMGIQVLYNLIEPAYFLTEPDGRFCVTIKAGAVVGHHAVIGACVGTAADTWTAATVTTGIDLTTGPSRQYQELYTSGGPPQSRSIGLTGDGLGAKTVVMLDRQRASQVWTDLPPSGHGLPRAVGNPDGSISLRSLANTGLCLTVPGARYVSGQQLTVQPCDGNADQEFLRMPNSFSDESVQELIPFGDGRFCVGTPKGISAGAPVALVTCAPKTAPTWIPMQAWYQWGGSTPSLYTYQPSIPPAGALTLGSISATGGAAVTGPVVPGSPAQAWLAMPSADGARQTYRPVYDTGWCLDAIDLSAGAAVSVQACDDSANQGFKPAPITGPNGFPYQQIASDAAPGLCLAQGAGAGAVSLAACAAVTSQMWWSL